MSASRIIVATASHKRKRHGKHTQPGSSPETAALVAENDELKKENFFLKKETEKLSEQLKFWRSECERNSESTEENHWRRRYSSRHQEAQRLEGLLALAK